MAEIKYGTVTVTIDDALKPPDDAGHLDAKAVQGLAKARHGVGLVCESAAESMVKAGGPLSVPPTLTADALRKAGVRAEQIDQVIRDLDVVRNTLQQANLLFDAEAHIMLGRLNDQVKAQSKDNPALLDMFSMLTTYFARSKPSK
jgi:hypothetical protein